MDLHDSSFWNVLVPALTYPLFAIASLALQNLWPHVIFMAAFLPLLVFELRRRKLVRTPSSVKAWSRAFLVVLVAALLTWQARELLLP